ncbi:hypothetical protein BGX29_000859, partial [Mortierella sp. GBA35]
FLGSDYKDAFVPQGRGGGGHYNRPALDLFQQAVIVPFSEDQIGVYVEQYVSLEPRAWTKEDYMDKLTTIPNLLDLVTNPFLLILSLEVLPSVVQGKSDLSSLHITRVELYDTFVENWLKVNKRRLRNLKLSGDDKKAFAELMEDGFEQNGIKFQKDLAAAIFQQQGGRTVVDYTQKRDKTSWKAAFFSPEPEATLLRAASLLIRTGNQHRFVHRSVLEYFFSCTFCGPSGNKDEFDPQPNLDSTLTRLPIADHPMSQRNLFKEPSVVLFLAERVQSNPAFKHQLLSLIGLSKTDAEACQTGSNAAIILMKAGVRLHAAELREVVAPWGVHRRVNATSFNLTNIWTRREDLDSASREDHRRRHPDVVAFSPNGRHMVTAGNNNDVLFRSSQTGRTDLILCDHTGDLLAATTTRCGSGRHVPASQVTSSLAIPIAL